jgi:hypothetical protein
MSSDENMTGAHTGQQGGLVKVAPQGVVARVQQCGKIVTQSHQHI